MKCFLPKKYGFIAFLILIIVGNYRSLKKFIYYQWVFCLLVLISVLLGIGTSYVFDYLKIEIPISPYLAIPLFSGGMFFIILIMSFVVEWVYEKYDNKYRFIYHREGGE